MTAIIDRPAHIAHMVHFELFGKELAQYNFAKFIFHSGGFNKMKNLIKGLEKEIKISFHQGWMGGTHLFLLRTAGIFHIFI